MHELNAVYNRQLSDDDNVLLFSQHGLLDRLHVCEVSDDNES